ncbi:MAG: S-layer homology domain-containing protein, partial [Oscillospiraceae bacterium]|nr:S-layer homology domain-containing protein [Oscillospiraceae bacterium]
PGKVMDGVGAVVVSVICTLAVKSDGSVWTWGLNYFGQLGSGSTDSSSLPVPVSFSAGTDSPAVQNPFIDVSQDAYYYEPVLWAVERGVANGVTATTFAPDNVCTRGEIITFLWRAMGKPEPLWSDLSDVSESDFYYLPVQWAYGRKIASGGTFSPKDPCTRAQAVEFLWKAAGSPAASRDAGFSDVPAAYTQAVNWAAENGIAAGTGPAVFSPNSTCTRGQIVTLLWRALARR